MGKRCIHYRLGQNLNEVWEREVRSKGYIVPMHDFEREIEVCLDCSYGEINSAHTCLHSSQTTSHFT